MSDVNSPDSPKINPVEVEEASKGESSELPKPPKSMAETEQQQQEQQPEVDQTASSETAFKRSSIGNVSFSIWPPTQRTRDAVINRLIETLSSPSVLSNRYGVIPHEEASEAAKRIEDEAYAAAGASASASADDDGIEILQVYSKEISRRMLDTVKSRSASATATASAAAAADAGAPPENKPQEDAAADGGITEEVAALKVDS